MEIARAECARLRCEPGIASTLAHADRGALILLFVLYILGTVAWSARWRALLRFAGADMRLGQVWRISTEAQAGGVLLPGGVGGDALRVALAVSWMNNRRCGSSRSPVPLVVASVLLDRAIGLAVIAAIAATVGFAGGAVRPGRLTVVLTAIPVGFVAGLLVLRTARLDHLSWLIEGRMGQVTKPLLAYVRDPRAPRAITIAAALSLLVAGVQFVTIRGLVYALGATPTAEKWVYVGSAMAFVVGALPALPGGWGTADAAYVFFLAWAGLPASVALAVCLLYRLFWYLLAMAGAVLHVSRRHASEASARTAPPQGPLHERIDRRPSS
ncbi:MAG: flippase-like domain-containing protein [Myxococcota bacterium]|nr:flippase-like domain-containing protein [Myxococcota bacterium]